MADKDFKVKNGIDVAGNANIAGNLNAAKYQNSAPSSPVNGQIWIDSNANTSVLNTNDFVLKADASASSGYLLKTDAASTYATIASAYRYVSTTYLTSGSGTYTVPAGTRALRIRMVGGGGGGAGSGGGSGAGNAGNGSTGGTTTFGSSLLTCTGGGGGYSSGQGVNTPGTATLNSPATGLATSGAWGLTTGQYNTALQVYTGGQGGPSTPLGAYGSGGNSSGAGGTPVCMGASGSTGGYIEANIISPAASYSYAIGSGGAGGTAGTSGSAGATGAGGIIIIEVYV
jgi:hypothetical protein